MSNKKMSNWNGYEIVDSNARKRLEDMEKQGVGGASTVVVEVGYDAEMDIATASHTANEIYLLVQGGATVVAVVNGENRYPYKRAFLNTEGKAYYVEFSFTEVGEQEDNVTTYGVSIDESKDAVIWYNELLGGNGSGGDVSTGAMQAAIAAAIQEHNETLEVHSKRLDPMAAELVAIKQTVSGLTAEKVGADPAGTAATKVSEHDTYTGSHNDIRLLIQGLSDRLNALANSDDTTLDDLKEIVTYIKANKSLIDSITTSKVSVTDIIDNLTTNVSNRPLSAAQGVALKNLIDALGNSKLDASALGAAVNQALLIAKESGEFKGETGATGPQGPKGDPYTLTEDDKTEIVTAVKEESEQIIVDELARRGQLKPEFANDISECTDTSKLYVLPDGYIYGYMKKSVAIKHRVDNSTLKLNKRLGNSQSMTTYTNQNGNATTEPIEVDNTLGVYTVNISGISALYPLYYAPMYTYYFDADGNFIANKGAKQLGLTTNNEANLPIPESGVFTFDVVSAVDASQWANTKYICFVLGLAAGTAIDSNTDAVKNVNINVAPLDSYETSYNWYSTGHMFNTDDYGQAIEKNAADIDGLDDRVSEVEKKIEEGLPSTGTGTDTSPLFNKLGLIGDSLTNQEYQGWQALVVSMLHIPAWHKNAITGSTVARYSDTTLTPFVERYLDTPEDCDCVVIMGGTNDSSKDGEYMGEVGVLANDTFKGAYSTIIEGLLARNPATRVMLMTPPRSYSTSLVLHERIGKYAEATKEIAKFYGLPCLDLYDTLGWNAKTAEWCSWDFAANDTVHFSKAVGPRVGRMVANFIRNNY